MTDRTTARASREGRRVSAGVRVLGADPGDRPTPLDPWGSISRPCDRTLAPFRRYRAGTPVKRSASGMRMGTRVRTQT